MEKLPVEVWRGAVRCAILPALLCLLLAACGGGNGSSSSGGVVPHSVAPISAVDEACKSEATTAFGTLSQAIRMKLARPPYSGDADKLGGDIAGVMDAKRLGLLGLSGLDGRNYKSADYRITYLGSKKFRLEAKTSGDALYQSHDLQLR